ncbi:MAG: septal ring lytic transglycosylase RlpA family protein [Neisseriaceae bacterium]|jgi:rare lipoprotein A (peptidoglycan hydrolase)
MNLKKLLSIFIFMLTLIKPALATTKVKHEVENARKTTRISKRTYNKKSENHKQHLVARRDFMHGLASYYGKGDHANGKPMADGEIFDTYDPFVAAHPTLPLGTKLKVINNSNGKVAYVEIKDRMPRHKKRVIDLSYAAAGEIGMQHRGLSHVTLVRIDNSEFYKHKRMIEDAENSDTNQNDNS